MHGEKEGLPSLNTYIHTHIHIHTLYIKDCGFLLWSQTSQEMSAPTTSILLYIKRL